MVRGGFSKVTVMENQEAILDALTDFEKKPNKESIPPLLDSYLLEVAKTGETLFPWARLKSLFMKKLDCVMRRFNDEYPADHLPTCPNVENVKFEEIRRRILAAVEKFHGAPFTIQRLCELITDPMRHYKRSDKFLRGIEKNVLVVSTVDPFGRKVVSESRNIVNGLDVNGHSGSIRTPPHTPPPPIPSPPLWSADATVWPSKPNEPDSPPPHEFENRDSCIPSPPPDETDLSPLTDVLSSDSENLAESCRETNENGVCFAEGIPENKTENDPLTASSDSSTNTEQLVLASGDFENRGESVVSPTYNSGDEEESENECRDDAKQQPEILSTKIENESSQLGSSEDSSSDSSSSFEVSGIAAEEEIPEFLDSSDTISQIEKEETEENDNSLDNTHTLEKNVIGLSEKDLNDCFHHKQNISIDNNFNTLSETEAASLIETAEPNLACEDIAAITTTAAAVGVPLESPDSHIDTQPLVLSESLHLQEQTASDSVSEEPMEHE